MSPVILCRRTAEPNSNNQDHIQDDIQVGDCKSAPSCEPCTQSSTSIYADQQVPCHFQQTSLVHFQPSTTWQLGDPTFEASLLSQHSMSASANLPLPSTTPSFPPVNHISTKTKQAIFWCSEHVEFDLLLPENLSLLTNNELTGLSKSVSRKQVELPNPRKKMHVDSMDKWLSIFTIHYRIIRFADLLASPMTLIYVRKRLEIFPSIEENRYPTLSCEVNRAIKVLLFHLWKWGSFLKMLPFQQPKIAHYFPTLFPQRIPW